MGKTQFTAIPAYPQSREVLRYFREKTGLSEAEILKKITDHLIQLASRHNTAKFNLIFEYSTFPEPQIVIKTQGETSFLVGQLSEKELGQLTKKSFQEVRLDIAEINEKDIRTTENKVKP